MEVLDEIRARLRGHPLLRIQERPNQLLIEPPSADGFTVSILCEDGEYTVGYDGWHEIFQSHEEAINCFLYGLFGDGRLRVVIRGSYECGWSLERRQGLEWQEVSSTSLIFTPFWRRKRIVYRRNAIEAPDAAPT